MAITNVTSAYYWTWAASVSQATAAVLPKRTVDALRRLDKPVLNFKNPALPQKHLELGLGLDDLHI